MPLPDRPYLPADRAERAASQAAAAERARADEIVELAEQAERLDAGFDVRAAIRSGLSVEDLRRLTLTDAVTARTAMLAAISLGVLLAQLAGPRPPA